MNQADFFDEFLELIGKESQVVPITKVVGFVDIFPMALVSFNFDQRFRRYHQNCVAVPLEKLCAETVYLFSTYSEAEFPLVPVTKVVENFLYMFNMYLFTTFSEANQKLLAKQIVTQKIGRIFRTQES